MSSFEIYLFFGALLILVSVAITRFSHNLGVPSLLLFPGVGIIVFYHSAIIGHPIVELGLPKDSLIALISRNNEGISSFP